MAQFSEVNDIFNEVKDLKNISELNDNPILDQIFELYKNENESLVKKVHQHLRSFEGDALLNALGGIKFNNYDPEKDYMENALGCALAGNYPNRINSRYYMVLLVVPRFYVLLVTINTDDNKKCKSVNFLFKSFFQSSFLLPFTKIGNLEGKVLKDVVEFKEKVDNKQPLDPELKPGNNDPFEVKKEDDQEHITDKTDP